MTSPASPALSESLAAPAVGASSRHRILPLTSARFIAALLIVLMHTSGSPLGFAFTTETKFMLGAGVSFFFVLSGFIITYTYGQLNNRTEVLDFWGARVARIWPTHALTFLLCIALIPASEWALGQPPLLPALANITLSHAAVPVPSYYFSFNSPSWSISTEAFFYLLYPLAILGFQWKPWVPFAAAVLGIATTISLSLGLGLPSFGAETLSQATSHGMVSISPLTCFLEFTCGMYAAAAWPLLKRRLTMSRMRFTVLEIAAITLAAVSVIGFQALGAALEARLVPDAVTLWVRFHASAVCLGLLVMVLALEGGYITKALSWRPLVILGEISFATYMLHQLAIRTMLARGWHMAEGNNAVMFALFTLLITALSYATWIAVEKPSRQFLNRRLRSRAA